MFDVFGALKEVASAIRDIFRWQTGGRTRDQNAIRQELEHWRHEYERAMAEGDIDRLNQCLHELLRLRREAEAKRPEG
jgi:hypothetical protein